jgi:hypothetical protein
VWWRDHRLRLRYDALPTGHLPVVSRRVDEEQSGNPRGFTVGNGNPHGCTRAVPRENESLEAKAICQAFHISRHRLDGVYAVPGEGRASVTAEIHGKNPPFSSEMLDLSLPLRRVSSQAVN